MLQKEFLKDLSVAYLLLQESDKELQKLYEPTEKNEYMLKELLDIAELEHSKEGMLVAASRIVSLKEDSLIQEMKKAKFSQEKIDKKLLEIYEYVSTIWLKRHEEFLDECDSKKLFSGFYRTLLRGVHKVGVELTKWQPNWTVKIIHEQNRELKERFKDSSKVMEFLRSSDLLEKDGESEADRSYSVLIKDGEGYIKQPYALGFADEVRGVVSALGSLCAELSSLEDEVYEQKEEWLNYLEAIKSAFSQEESSKVLEAWREVDRCWMEITTPIQLGHPLEYYEDHYRKAVALEWDIRFINPKLDRSEHRGRTLKYLSDELLNAIGGSKRDRLKDAVSHNIKKTQLYIGRPALFYGAEMNGLFSAQVVPNDEVVSGEKGKKIFAFADFVLQSSRAKPFLELDREIFGVEFLNKERHILFKEPKLWHELYDIETIGHEYGHILFVDDDTEMIMNKSGEYKNCEEFKATSGGIVAHFYKEGDRLSLEIFRSVIKRAIKLIAWMESDEVEPYYVEGLIHLSLLFKAGVLHFDSESKKFTISLDAQNLKDARDIYFETYRALGAHYVEKKDSKEFLENFVSKEDRFKPKDEIVRAFVEHYWSRYLEIGQKVDSLSKREDWV
jgi:hypothetical protein